ncbi:hypothetical protein EV359DRAFT_88054 [Lentinula novae-zelandiae]|nr:hypothetical protein EV359DRAFT_88054 [Lentinula novae-zelandiae]
MSIVALWDLALGNVKASHHIHLCIASPLLPPPLEDINHYLPLPGTSFPGSHSIGSSHLLQFVLCNPPTSPSSWLHPSSPVIILGTSLDLLGTPSRVTSHNHSYY